MKVRIRTNNSQGWMYAEAYDGLVMAQPKARGVVQPQMIPTINTSMGGGCGVLIIKEKKEDEEEHTD